MLVSKISYFVFRLFQVLSRHHTYFKQLFRLLPLFTSRPTRYSAEMFGDAITNYFFTKRKPNFLLYQHCFQKEYNGQISNFNIGIYFRKLDQLFPLERKIIDLSYGNILDIGSNTGYYFPYLMEKGNTIGIEISPKINEIARKNGINNSIVVDFFSYKSKNPFDTITLFGNEIGISGSLSRLKKMLKKFKDLLQENGQVLIIIRHIRTLKYWHVVYTPQYNGHFGIPSKYLFLNTNFFRQFALKNGFRLEILGKDESTGSLYYLVRLVKI